MTVLDAVEHLVGMQAQAPFAPYYGLWSRLDGFTGDELAGLLTSRKAVRIVLMRGTIHLVTAKDCHRLRSLVQPALDRMLRANATHGRPLAAVDVTSVVDAAQRLLDAEALTPGEVGARLAEQWPDSPPGSLAEAARSLLPLVQVPPRALWQRSGQVRLTTATAWLGQPRGKRLTIDELVMRYLAAFGPASAADAQTWSGLTRLGEVLERLTLMRLKTEGGQTLYDIPDAPRPDADTPAPVRLVARSTTSCSHMPTALAPSPTSIARGCSRARTGCSPARCWSTGSSQARGSWLVRAKRRPCGCSPTTISTSSMT